MTTHQPGFHPAAPNNAPILLGRGEPQLQLSPHAELFEEALLQLLRQHYPVYMKLDGRHIRMTMNRAFLRFLLERTRGNQSRSAELAGINRNTIRKLIRSLAIDWRRYLSGGRQCRTHIA